MGLLGCNFGEYIFQQRYVVCIMACISLMVLHGSQYALYATIPHLINVEADKFNYTEKEVCPTGIYYMRQTENVNVKNMEWSKTEKQYIFNSFFVGFTFLLIPAGIVCDFYGARHFLSLAILCTGFVVAFVPIVVTETPWYCTAILEIILGSLQGICLPALISLMSHWIPNEQQTFLTACSYSGGSLGIMISNILLNSILQNWRIVFYFWSALAVVWYVVFLIFVYSRPITHPFICDKEKFLLRDQFGDAMPKRIPWRNVISDVGVWALAAGQLAYNSLTIVLITHTPKFFRHTMGFDMRSNVYWSTLPYLCQWITTIVSGCIGDCCIAKNYIPVVYMRMIFVGIGNVLPSCFMLFTTYMGCNKGLILFWFTCTMIARGCVFAGLKPNLLDLSRHYSGIIEGISIGLPALSTMAIEQFILFLCRRSTINEWRKLFLFSFIVCAFTTMFYCIWCTDKKASWDIVLHENTGEITKE